MTYLSVMVGFDENVTQIVRTHLLHSNEFILILDTSSITNQIGCCYASRRNPKWTITLQEAASSIRNYIP